MVEISPHAACNIDVTYCDLYYTTHLPRQLQPPDQHNHPQQHQHTIQNFKPNFRPELQILHTKLLRLTILPYQRVLQWPQLHQYLPNLLTPNLEAEIIQQQFEDDTDEGEGVFGGFPLFVGFLVVDGGQHADVYAPEKVVYDVVKEGGDVREQLQEDDQPRFLRVDQLHD